MFSDVPGGRCIQLLTLALSKKTVEMRVTSVIDTKVTSHDLKSSVLLSGLVMIERELMYNKIGTKNTNLSSPVVFGNDIATESMTAVETIVVRVDTNGLIISCVN